MCQYWKKVKVEVPIEPWVGDGDSLGVDGGFSVNILSLSVSQIISLVTLCIFPQVGAIFSDSYNCRRKALYNIKLRTAVS